MTKKRILVIDTCTLINLLASGEIESILSMAGEQFLICTAVQEESLYLRADNPTADKEKIDLTLLVDNGVLTLCQLETPDEEQLYVNFASQLDDGEAMTLAIAINRNFELVTDEKKARRLYREATGSEDSLKCTSQLIRQWAERTGISGEQLKMILLKIQQRARYHPPNWDANNDWWTDACQ